MWFLVDGTLGGIFVLNLEFSLISVTFKNCCVNRLLRFKEKGLSFAYSFLHSLAYPLLSPTIANSHTTFTPHFMHSLCQPHSIEHKLDFPFTHLNKWSISPSVKRIFSITYLLTTKWGLYPTVVVFLNGFENGKLTFIIFGLYRSTAIRIWEFLSVVESMAYKTPQTMNISPNFLWSNVMFQLYWTWKLSVSSWNDNVE